jgi:hypothetical protein
MTTGIWAATCSYYKFQGKADMGPVVVADAVADAEVDAEEEDLTRLHPRKLERSARRLKNS